MKSIIAVIYALLLVFSGNRTEEINCVYEAVFLDNTEVMQLFEEIRGDQLFEKQTSDFHVTTAFMPSEAAAELYGKPVTVHITGYKVGDVVSDDGSITTNEGLQAELFSEDEQMQAYLDALEVNFHITGSFKDAAKYTGYIDFSDAEPMDITLTGTFGGFCTDNAIHLAPARIG